MRPDRTQTWVMGPVRTIKASSADSVWCKCDLVHSRCLLRRWWMQFFTLLLETVGGKNCCTGGDNIIRLQWGQFAKDNCTRSRRGHWQKLRFASCGGNYFLAFFFFLQLSCWLLLTCFYWHNEFFFFLSVSFMTQLFSCQNQSSSELKALFNDF